MSAHRRPPHPNRRCQAGSPRPAAATGRRLIRLTGPLGAALLALFAPGSFPRAHEMRSTDDGEGAPTRSIREYAIPHVRLVRADGKMVSLPEEMNDGRPIVLNFIFTTCTDICPLMSSVLEGFERRLGTDADKVHLMSISIDPEQDTPARLLAYAKKFHAGPGWQHYTGTREASITAQRAFDVYRGSKMSHTPVTLIRAAPGKPWLRIDGFVTPDDLVRDYRSLLARS
ncbi:MAG TPA: SCO family protein [Anaeromyxobacter sp.]|nr:SCO family protein [Anaeromyxobacter sp.]